MGALWAASPPQHRPTARSQRHSVLVTHFQRKSIAVCKPEILLSMLYSATLMRIKSMREKYLLSMLIVYFSNITILDSGFFCPQPNALPTAQVKQIDNISLEPL